MPIIVECESYKDVVDVLNDSRLAKKSGCVFVDWTKNKIEFGFGIETDFVQDALALDVEDLGITPEMTAEYWEKEEREVTAYGVRDEYGGL